MKFYSFGMEDKPVLLLLPGTCCHWKRTFGHVIPLLEKNFQVVCASYDGFDETEDTVFPDMLTETERIEAYVRSHFAGEICAAYGCSLGGSIVGLLIQRGKIHIGHGILGSSDLDQGGGLTAWVQARIIAQTLYGMLQKGTLPGWMQRRLNQKDPQERVYLEKMLKIFGFGETPFIKRKSIFNQFYSDLTTPLETGISAPGTVVHIFYAVKMGQKYEARYRRHFKAPDIRRHNLRHEELLICQPQRWVEEVVSCLWGKNMPAM